MTAIMYALITAAIWGIVPVLEKIGLGRIDPVVGLFYRSFGALIGMCIIGISCYTHNISLKADVKSISFLIVSGLLASFIAQFFLYRALKIGQVSIVIPVTAAYPLIAFIAGIIIFQERISVNKVLGMVMIILGIFFLKK